MIAADAEVTLPTGAVLYLNPDDGTYECAQQGRRGFAGCLKLL